MSRFEDLPGRMRRASEALAGSAHRDIGEWLALSSLLQDGALKIEALERELQRFQSDRAYTVGFIDGYDAKER